MSAGDSYVLLFDSNVFFAAHGISKHAVHPDGALTSELMGKARRYGCELAVGLATMDDIGNDRNVDRKKASTLNLKQWKRLARISSNAGFLSRAGYPSPPVGNDRVDAELLELLERGAADILVTQDKGLRAHANTAGLADRVCSIAGAAELLDRLFGIPPPPPNVGLEKVYELDGGDEFFDSLRAGYAGFDAWLRSAAKRDCFTIRNGGRLDAVAIVKVEDERAYGLDRTVIKVCTLKVADHAAGAKRGELLLRPIFDYARRHGATQVYVEVFDEHAAVISLCEQFGFVRHSQRSSKGEAVMVKTVRPTGNAPTDPLEFHIRFGPPAVLVRDAFVVPVIPEWHDILFPEARDQQQLPLGLDMAPGNAILKAYLSGSKITRLQPGSLLLFYRSHTAAGVTAVGVVDCTLRSRDPVAVRRFVGQRTVYTDAQIREQFTDGGEVLAVRFRHDRTLPETWSRAQLLANAVINGPPQSLQQVSNQGALTWIRQQLDKH